jgi:hypothetical protein
MSVPVMKLAVGVHKKTAIAATSSAWPTRGSADLLTKSCMIGLFSISARPMGVSMMPGDIEAIRAPRAPKDGDIRSTNNFTARFETV